MTTIEFYNFALIAAESKGYKNPNITTMSCCFQGEIRHTCQLWDNKKGKNIHSGQHMNPLSALEAFKDALEYEGKTYSTISAGVDL